VPGFARKEREGSRGRDRGRLRRDRLVVCHTYAGVGPRRPDRCGGVAPRDHLERGGRVVVPLQGLPRGPRALLGEQDLRGLRGAGSYPRERRAHARGRGGVAGPGPRPLVGERGAWGQAMHAGRAAARLPRRAFVHRADCRDAGLPPLPAGPLRPGQGTHRAQGHRIAR
jgi:hypothetical protein